MKRKGDTLDTMSDQALQALLDGLTLEMEALIHEKAMILNEQGRRGAIARQLERDAMMRHFAREVQRDYEDEALAEGVPVRTIIRGG